MGDVGDLLVRLYDLPQGPVRDGLAAAGIEIRRALPPERLIVLDWVTRHFGSLWAAEVEMGFGQHPVTVWLAVRGNALLGFACHDATAKGFFGPTGVDAAARGQGVGEALLFATLNGMRAAGYAYAVIGDPGPVEFYCKRLDASVIPKSKPGLYRGMLRPQLEDRQVD